MIRPALAADIDAITPLARALYRPGMDLDELAGAVIETGYVRAERDQVREVIEWMEPAGYRNLPWSTPSHTNGHRPTGPRERTTWWPVSLADAAAEPPRPTILSRADGCALLYPGRLHAGMGESESNKSWFAQLAVAEVAEAGGHVLVVDFEDVEATTHQRLSALGVGEGRLAELVHFIHPEEPLGDRHGRATHASMDLDEALAEWPITLAVFDGMNEGMVLEGLNPLDNADIATWYRSVPKRATRTGAAGLVLDHVTKNADTRGRYAIGGVHKLNGLDGAAYAFDVAAPFAPGCTGRVRLTIAKDRPGAVRATAPDPKRKQAGTLVLTSHAGGRVTASIDAPGEHDTGGPFEPTFLMEKVSRHLELYPGATKSDLRKLGNSNYVDTAIERLVERGCIRIAAEGRAHRHHSITPYREDQETGDDGTETF